MQYPEGVALAGCPRGKRVLMVMRLVSLVVAAVLAAGPVQAQQAKSSPEGAGKSAAEDGSPSTLKSDLPVSLDHIREGLKKATDQTLLRMTELPADFRVVILEQQRIDKLMSKLDFKSGPAPAGGVYAFEQQRRLFNPTDRPLMQPYAAFSAGEFITIALENLIGRYLGGRVLNAVTGAERERAEHAAREEVDRAIAEYCASRPDRLNIQLCTTPNGDR